MADQTEILSPKETAPRGAAVEFVHTANFPSLLRTLKLSLMVTTYQAKRILTFCPKGEKLSMLMRIFERPTGFALHRDKLAMYAGNRVWIFKALDQIKDERGEQLPYDVCFVPRLAYITGDIAGHEIAFHGEELLVVNTRFSCISTLSPDYSFVPGWKPPFISDYAAEDRCHLNGITVDQTGPRYLTALAETDQKEGWRPVKADGGIIMEYPSGEIISRGLSMPHSPRLYGGKLWVLNSGIGALQLIDTGSGKRETVVKLPGFLRGLAFAGPIAFIGVCQIREKKTFGNLPIEEMFSELECAIYAVDIRSGAQLGFIRFTKGIQELFDITVLSGVQNPHVIGFEEDMINGVFVLP